MGHHQKAFLFIFLLVILAFSHSLGGQFIADDNFLIVQNGFYKSFSNIKYLFSDVYFLDSDRTVGRGELEIFSSGSVAYRPVLTLTYFIDYAVWGLNPFGYRLTNLLLHLGNAFLFYGVVFLILRQKGLARFAACLFAVHPYTADVVCNTGYRADLLAVLFLLGSFYFFLLYRRDGKSHILWSSLLVYFFGLFSKESVIIFPFLLMAYEFVFHQTKIISKSFLQRIGGYLLMSLFYVSIYLFIFPNKAIHQVQILSTSISGRWLGIFYILSDYTVRFFSPSSVKIIPPNYVPNISQGLALTEWLGMALTAGLFLMACVCLARRKKIGFFLLWWFVGLIPVSNIIPLVNPMANRYLYLPCLGLVGFVAFGIVFIQKWMEEKRIVFNFQGVARICLLGWCVFTTIIMSASYKNDHVLAASIVEDYPDDPKGYFFLAQSYIEAGMIDKAKYYLKESFKRGLHDPRGFYWKGILSEDKRVREVSLAQSIATYPYFGLSYIALGRMYLFDQKESQAVGLLETGVKYSPTLKGHLYLWQAYLMTKQKEKADQIEKSIRENFPHQETEKYILFLEEYPQKIPFDWGV